MREIVSQYFLEEPRLPAELGVRSPHRTGLIQDVLLSKRTKAARIHIMQSNRQLTLAPSIAHVVGSRSFL
jgi:hypothetical protein